VLLDFHPILYWGLCTLFLSSFSAKIPQGCDLSIPVLLKVNCSLVMLEKRFHISKASEMSKDISFVHIQHHYGEFST
jgi:hypothetical protein